MKPAVILFVVICVFSCFSKNVDGKRFKEIDLSNNIKIAFPLTKEYDENRTYTHIQILVSGQKIFEDTTETEYLFNDKEWPKVIKTPNGLCLLYMKIFDAPDFNKLFQLTISESKLIRRDTLPYFYEPAKEIDGQRIYSGTLHVVETPCINCDSCYYNPKLYYRFTDNGILLDSALTVKMNTKQWNGFYGFTQRMDIIRPCK